MALLDRVREAWEDLRGTHKEEQETASVGQSVADSPMQWAKDYKAAATPGEAVEPVALDRDTAGNIATLALDSEPARLKRVENMLDHGSTENAPTVDRPGSQDPALTFQDRPRTAQDEMWDEQYRFDERNLRVEASVGPKHDREFTFEKETGDIYTYKHDPTGNRIHLDSKGDFYDVQEGEEPTLTTRAEVLRAYQEPSPEVAATLSAEHREKWVPLEKELGFTGADAFNHYATRGDVQVYMTEVNDSKRLIGLDDKGEFYNVDKNGKGGPISRDEALYHVHIEPSFYTPAERSLREAMGNDVTPDLLRYERSGNIQSYQYAPTGGAVHIDSEGKFYNADRETITRDEALSTMHTVGGDGLRSIAPAPAYAPIGASEYEGVPHRVATEIPMSQGPVQQAVQEQSISM